MWLWWTVSSPDPVDDEGLKKCIMKTSINLKKLLNFFKDVAALHENTDQGDHTQQTYILGV